MFEFIGRERELELMSIAWDKAQNQEMQWLSIQAESGIGKTRLVHEFYSLFSNSLKGSYWPERLEIIGNNLALNLQKEQLSKNKLRSFENIPAIWWGIRCADNGEENGINVACAVLNSYDSLEPHTTFLRLKERNRNNISTVSKDIGKKALNLLTGGASDLIISSLELWSNAEKISQNSNSFEPQKVYQLQKTDSLDKIFKELLGLFDANIPVVIVVDDIHWVDDDTYAFISKLLSLPISTKLLIISTTREKEWSQEKFRTLRKKFKGGFSKLKLGSLPGRLMKRLCHSEFPCLTPSELQLFLRRTDGNPQYLYEISYRLKLKSDLYFENADHHTSLLPTAPSLLNSETFNFDNLVEERFLSLPRDVRGILEACCMQGKQFSAEVMSEFPLHKFTNIQECSIQGAINSSVSPNGYVLSLDTDLYEFYQGSYHTLVQTRLNTMPEHKKQIVTNHYLQKFRELDSSDLSLPSKLKVIQVAIPFLNEVDRVRGFVEMTSILVEQGQLREALNAYKKADQAFANLRMRNDFSIPLRQAILLNKVVLTYPSHIISNLSTETSVELNVDTKPASLFKESYSILVSFIRGFMNKKLSHEHDSNELANALVVFEGLWKLSYALSHQNLEWISLKNYLKLFKGFIIRNTSILTIDILFSYLNCLQRYVKLASRHLKDEKSWVDFFQYIDNEKIDLDKHFSYLESEEVIDRKQREHGSFIIKNSIQVSALAWALVSYDFFEKDRDVEETYRVFCYAADKIADEYFPFIELNLKPLHIDMDFERKFCTSTFESRTKNELTLILRTIDELIYVSNVNNFSLSNEFLSKCMLLVEWLLKKNERHQHLEIDSLQPCLDILSGVTAAINKESKPIPIESEKRIEDIQEFQLKERQLTIDEIKNIVKTATYLTNNLIEEKRFTPSILASLCRIEWNTLELTGDNDSKSRIKCFELCLQRSQFINEAFLLYRDGTPPILPIIKMQYEKWFKGTAEENQALSLIKKTNVMYMRILNI